MGLTWYKILEIMPLLCLLFISGSIGSIVAGIVQHEKRTIWIFKNPIELGFIGDVLIGGVASIGIFFFAASLLGLTTSHDLSTPDILKVISLGILSGFTGVQILTNASRKLSKDIFDIKQDIELDKNQFIALSENFKADEFLRDGLFEQAFNSYNEALRSDPSNEHALIGKAKALRRLNDCKQAIEILKDVIKANSNSTRAIYNLACYMNISKEPVYKKSEVIALIIEVLEKAYRYFDLAIADEDLDSIRDEIINLKIK